MLQQNVFIQSIITDRFYKELFDKKVSSETTLKYDYITTWERFPHYHPLVSKSTSERWISLTNVE